MHTGDLAAGELEALPSQHDDLRRHHHGDERRRRNVTTIVGPEHDAPVLGGLGPASPVWSACAERLSFLADQVWDTAGVTEALAATMKAWVAEVEQSVIATR